MVRHQLGHFADIVCTKEITSLAQKVTSRIMELQILYQGIQTYLRSQIFSTSNTHSVQAYFSAPNKSEADFVIDRQVDRTVESMQNTPVRAGEGQREGCWGESAAKGRIVGASALDISTASDLNFSAKAEKKMEIGGHLS